MAGLLKHERDMVAFCLVCGTKCEQLYVHEVIIPDERDQLCAAKCFQCSKCGSTYHRDYEPRPTATDLDINRIIDKREFAALRTARLRGLGIGLETMAGVAPPARMSAVSRELVDG